MPNDTHFFQNKLNDQKNKHLYRTRRILESAQGPEVVIEGKRYLAFCSNDYLGLATHPDVVNSFHQAAKRFGVGSGASNLVIGHHRIHHALEEELADFLQRPAALVFSTGTMANLGTIGALVSEKDTVIADKLVHASLIDAVRLSHARLQRYQHVNVESLYKELKKFEGKKKLIVTDGVFSMNGDLAPLPQLVKAAQDSNSWLYVDDAHGIGVCGEHGRGTLAHFGLGLCDVPILVGTFGKAFGTFGAFVSGSQDLIEYLIQFARTYIYTTALPPAVAEATRTSLKIIREETWRQAHLKKLITRFREGILGLGLSLLPSNTPIQPLVIGSSEEALQMSERLSKAGIYVPAIRPPTVPPGQVRLRITLSAGHTEEQVEVLIDNLKRLLLNKKA